jgi:hypothetical protein
VVVHGGTIRRIDSALDLYARNSGMVATLMRDARQNTPKTGWGDPASYEGAASAAEQKVADANWANCRALTIDPVKAEAEADALAFAGALTDLTKEVSACNADYLLPATLRGTGPGSSSADQEKIAGAERHYRGMIEPIARACADWNALEEQNAPEPQVRLFIAAVRGLCIEARDQSQLRAAERDPRRSVNQDGERDLAWRLLLEMDKYEATRAPQSIAIALSCLSILRAAFLDLCGVSHKFMSNAEFDAAILRTDSSQVDAALPFKLASTDTWLTRYLPGPGVTAYPGYSRIAGKSGMGQVYRVGTKGA